MNVIKKEFLSYHVSLVGIVALVCTSLPAQAAPKASSPAVANSAVAEVARQAQYEADMVIIDGLNSRIDGLSSDLAQASADLAQARADLSQANASLAQASADLAQASADLQAAEDLNRLLDVPVFCSLDLKVTDLVKGFAISDGGHVREGRPLSVDWGSAVSVKDHSISFQCAIDQEPTLPCVSPLSLGVLAVGDHSISVWPVTEGGALGQAISSSFIVDEYHPPVLFSHGSYQSIAGQIGTSEMTLTAGSWDDGYGLIALPFDFAFRGADKHVGDEIAASTNGYLMLAELGYYSGNTFGYNARAVYPASYAYLSPFNFDTLVISPFNRDIDLRGTGSLPAAHMYFRVDGSEQAHDRSLTIEWNDFYNYSSGDILRHSNMQVVLHEGNTIEFRYGPGEALTQSASAMVGVFGLGSSLDIRDVHTASPSFDEDVSGTRTNRTMPADGSVITILPY